MSNYEESLFNSKIRYLKSVIPSDDSYILDILKNLYTAKSGGYDVKESEINRLESVNQENEEKIKLYGSKIKQICELVNSADWYQVDSVRVEDIKEVFKEG